MEELISSFIDNYGTYAVFGLLMLSGIGLALGEDLIVIPAGILVAHGSLHFWPVLAACYFGVVLSDMMWFLICYHFGTPLLHRKWFKRMIHPRRLLEIKHQMDERGAWILVFARFIPASRSTTITVTGMLHLPIWKFASITAACVVLTAPLQLGLGVLIGRNVGDVALADLVKGIIGGVMLIIAGTLVLRTFLRFRAKRRRPPRAKVTWLKRFKLPSMRRKPKRAKPNAVAHKK